MPIYEYRCSECDQIFEEWQKNFDEVEVHCPVCGNKAERLISHTSFILKGSGWYVTDYCGRKNGVGDGDAAPAGGNAAGDESKAAVAATPPAKAESKPAASTPAPSGGAAS